MLLPECLSLQVGAPYLRLRLLLSVFLRSLCVLERLGFIHSFR